MTAGANPFGVSLWEATSPPRPDRPALSGEDRADVAVIGGGFLGLSAALHLAGAGRRVVVLEADRVGTGASGRNAGFVVPNFARADPDVVIDRLGETAGERLIAATGASADLVFDLIRRHGIACDASPAGWIQPAHAAVAIPRLRRRMEQWARRGRPLEWLDRDRLAAMIGVDIWPGGWIDRSGGGLHPLAYAIGLAAAAERAGARIVERSPVVTLERAGDLTVARTAAGSVAAETVLVCTNAFGGPDPRLAAAFLPLTVYQIATTPLPTGMRDQLLPGDQSVGDSARNLFTMRLDAAGRLITGGMAVVPFGAAGRVPRTIHRRLSQRLQMPELPPIEFAWSGRAAIMPDFLPHIIDLGPGVLAGIGCNGRGIAVTAMLGRALADAALGVPAGELPVPITTPSAVPFHGLARFAPHAFLPYGMLRDALDRRSSAPAHKKSPAP